MKNIGRFAGKEVVQVYCGAGGTALARPVRELVGFAKTDTLQPGEDAALKIDVRLSDIARYDDIGATGYRSCFVLDAGRFRHGVIVAGRGYEQPEAQDRNGRCDRRAYAVAAAVRYPGCVRYRWTVRAAFDNGDRATCIPNGTLICCTWNRELARRLYMYEGMEARANDVDALLEPGINIHRLPLCGRNFKYVSEDPLLAESIAAEICRGLKDGGITATVKHFAANNMEQNSRKFARHAFQKCEKHTAHGDENAGV